MPEYLKNVYFILYVLIIFLNPLNFIYLCIYWITYRKIRREITLWCSRARRCASIHVPLIVRSVKWHGVHSCLNVCRWMGRGRSYICFRTLSQNTWLFRRTGRARPLGGGIRAHGHSPQRWIPTPWLSGCILLLLLPRWSRPWWQGMGSSRVRCTAVATSPSASLVATGARAVVGAVFATLRGVFRKSRLSCVHGSMRAGVCHFFHTDFFQGEHGASLIECRKRVALANQSGNTAVSFWESRYQLKD